MPWRLVVSRAAVVLHGPGEQAEPAGGVGSGRLTGPNHGVQATANSLRSAPAIGGA